MGGTKPPIFYNERIKYLTATFLGLVSSAPTYSGVTEPFLTQTPHSDAGLSKVPPPTQILIGFNLCDLIASA